jgi:hypothetical protein
MRHSILFASCIIVSYIIMSCGYTHLEAPGVSATHFNLMQTESVKKLEARKTAAGLWELVVENATVDANEAVVESITEGVIKGLKK